MERAARIEQVLTYWFGELSGPTDVDRSKNELWWEGGEAVDADIRERFGDLVGAACAGDLSGWTREPRGALALVILLDQFTRNVHRGTAEAFSGDARAVSIVDAAIASGHDRQLRFIERAFLYMPLMHAEDRVTAERSLAVFGALSSEISALGAELPDFVSSATQHADIVRQFGRYPHRNELLGRSTTDEERAFLDGGGPTFGQKKS